MEIRKLNTLRALAALIVVLSHYGNMNAPYTPWGKILGWGAGQLGVMLFFFLSGFLMSHLYMGKDCEASRVRRFLVARAARVLPLFIVVVLVSYALYQAGYKDVFYPIRDLPGLISHLALMYGSSVLWTIAPEIQFYLLFVPLWMLYARRPAYVYALMAVVVAILVALDFPNPIKGHKGYILDTKILIALPYFFVGVVLGRLYEYRERFVRFQSAWYLLALLLILLVYPNVYTKLFGVQHGMWQDWVPLVAIGIAFFFLVFLVPDNNPLLANPVGDFAGKVSYSWYLLHSPLLVLAKPVNQHYPLLMLPVFIAGSLFAAYVVYRLFEAPSRRGIRKLVD